MSVEEIKAMVMRFIDEPWNKGNVDVIDELCAPDYTVCSIPENWVGGREDLKKAILDYRMRAPDHYAAVGQLIISGDRVAYEWTMSGTLDGTLTKSFGITILHFNDGKILEDRFVSVEVKEG